MKGQDYVLIRTLVDKCPEIYLDELRDWVHYITGEEYRITTLHRFLRKCGLTVKKYIYVKHFDLYMFVYANSLLHFFAKSHKKIVWYSLGAGCSKAGYLNL